MKIVAKCAAFESLSYQVQVKVCNHIPLIYLVYIVPMLKPVRYCFAFEEEDFNSSYRFCIYQKSYIRM